MATFTTVSYTHLDVYKRQDVTPELCPAIAAANQKAEETDAPAGAMMLPDGRVITGKTLSLIHISRRTTPASATV